MKSYKKEAKKEVPKKVEPQEPKLNASKDTTGDETELNHKSQIKE